MMTGNWERIGIMFNNPDISILPAKVWQPSLIHSTGSSKALAQTADHASDLH